MTPKILDFENGRLTVTAEAYIIPEIKAIVDKYDMKAEPYLAYVVYMSSPTSPYINVPDDEKIETVTYDVVQSLGDFDIDDPLIQKAIDKFKSLYTSTMVRKYEAAKILHDKFTKYMKEKEITEGKDGNMTELMRILERLGTEMRSFKDLEKQVEEELKTKMRGKNVMGDY